MKIVGGKNKTDLSIQFLDEFNTIVKHVTYNAFITGGVRNPYDRTIFNVGYVGKGSNKTGGRIYSKWYDMIARCYDEQRRLEAKDPTYYKNIVCDDWHNFQHFARWFNRNWYDIGDEIMEIDKDVKFKHNKVYSPNTCLLLPKTINSLVSNGYKVKENGLVEGVKEDKRNGGYIVRYREEVVGHCDTPEEAAVMHDKAKKDYIVQITNERYKDKMPEEVYQAVINWIPDYIPKCTKEV